MKIKSDMEAEKLDPNEALSVYFVFINNEQKIPLSEFGLINKGKQDRNYYDYWIVDKHKYFLSKIKFGI